MAWYSRSLKKIGQIGGSTVWDDLRAPATAINPTGTAVAATVNVDDGTFAFANGANQTVVASFQLPHAWKEGSSIDIHVHWAKTTSAAGTVKWQMKYEWTNIGATRAGFSSFVDGSEYVSNSDTAGKHAIFSFPLVAGTGKTVSSQLIIVLQRLSSGAGADTYGAPATLMELDVHYQMDTVGSKQEYIK